MDTHQFTDTSGMKKAGNLRVFFLFFNIYLFLLRDRERAQTGEGQRERETQNLKQATGYRL